MNNAEIMVHKLTILLIDLNESLSALLNQFILLEINITLIWTGVLTST